MAKELPYFQFEPAYWMMGKIQLCSLETKGAFIDLCARYWNSECEMTIEDAEIFCGKNNIKQLLEKKIVTKLDTQIIIDFLDLQILKCAETSNKRRDAVNKRWAKHRNKTNTNEIQTDTSVLQTDTYKIKGDKRKEKKIIEDNIEERKRVFSTQVIYTNNKSIILEEQDVKEFISYWTEHGPNDKKMRFEKQTSFAIDRRLQT